MKVKMSCAQMRSTPDKKANLAKMRELVRVAAKSGAKLVAFPENATILTDDSSEFEAAIEPQNGSTMQLFCRWAREERVWLLVGSLPLEPKRAVGARAKRGIATNSSVLFSDAGKLVARYDKIHLFDVNLSDDRRYAESEKIKAGQKPVVAKTPWGVLGLSICYDLRFPELYRRHSRRGASLISVPAAFTKVTGQAHWDLLTRARAVENQCFALCPAQTGKPHPGRETYGHSRIIDPWGRVLAEKRSGEGVITTTLDFAEMARVRRELPALKHRRIT